jgi:hypothetical protein
MARKNTSIDQRSLTPQPASVAFVEGALLRILNRHYYVQQQLFQQISAHDMAKHELCHLTKALYKLQSFFDSEAPEDLHVIKTEVIPDMVIYALECAIKYKIDWWSPLAEQDCIPEENILGFLASKHRLAVKSESELLNSVRSMLIKAVSRLGHFCDKGDHSQDSLVNLESEVVIPFLKASLYLASYYEVNPDELFATRLVFVENNYVGQPALKG